MWLEEVTICVFNLKKMRSAKQLLIYLSINSNHLTSKLHALWGLYFHISDKHVNLKSYDVLVLNLY